MKRLPKTWIAQSRNGWIYHTAPKGPLPRGWEVEVIQAETIADVLVDIAMGALLALAMLCAVIGAVWLLGWVGAL